MLAALIISFAAVIASGSLTGSTGAGDIRIGSVLILSGDGASWGEASRNGLLMAQDDINAGGGVNGRNVTMVFQDDHGEPSQSVTAFNQLTNAEDIKTIVGFTWSNQGLAIAPLAARKKVLVISPSLGLASFNEQSPYLFNTWPHDEALSTALAEYVYAEGHRRVALVGTKQVWVEAQTAAFSKRFKELGGTIADAVEPLPDSVDVSGEAYRIAQAVGGGNATAVVFTTDGMNVGALVAKKLKELGVAAPKYAITIDAATIRASQGGYDGTRMLTFLTPSPAFAQRYRERFGREPDIGGDSAYDALMLIARAMNATGSQDPEVLAGYLNSIKTYDGASGNLTADGKGAFTKPYTVMRVVNGTAVPLRA